MQKNRLEHHHDHDRGLSHDLNLLTRMTGRRQALRVLLGASLIPIFGCGSSSSESGSGGSCDTIPEETAGPYPGDGSNGANALNLSGIVRSDIRSSLGTATGVAEGVPLTVKLTLVSSKGSCAPLAGYAIYLWHCDRDGNYSLYTVPSENYLRGVQETDSSGTVTFTSIFPACYSGRWPHIHFEVYPSLAKATSSTNKLRTSQLALPEEVCDEVFTTTGYSQSVRNLAQTSLTSDMVFSDGSAQQIPTMTGSVSEGYVATLKFGISA